MEKIILKSKYIDTNLVNEEYYIRDPFKDMSIKECDEKYGKGSYNDDITRRLLNAEFQLQNILKKQYMNTDLASIFKEHDEKEIMNFLNKYMLSEIKREWISYHPRYHGMLTDETREKFIKLASSVKNERGRELTVKDFLKFYRDCYDAAPTRVYPKEASDYFIYSQENEFNYVDDYYIINELNKIDTIGEWHNDKLAHFVHTTYLPRTLDYEIDATLYQLHSCLNLYRNSDTGIWTIIFHGWIDVCIRTIKQYICLREMGYNLAIDSDKVLEYYDYEIEYVKKKIEEDKQSDENKNKY